MICCNKNRILFLIYLKWIFLVNEDLSNQVVLIINKNIQMLE